MKFFRVKIDGVEYRAAVRTEVVIDRMAAHGWQWCGKGEYLGGKIVDCPADISQDVYWAIENAIEKEQ